MVTVSVAFVSATFPMSGPAPFATSKTAPTTSVSTVAPFRPASNVPFMRRMARIVSAPRTLRLPKLKTELSQTVNKIAASNFVLVFEMLKANGASSIMPTEREMIRLKSGQRRVSTASSSTVC